MMNDSKTPPLGNNGANTTGWESFVDSKMIKEAPKNDYVGGPNASRVVLGTKPDATFHTNYGWIFNPQTNDLWAVGFDASDKPLPRTNTTTTTNPVTPPTQTPTADASKEPLSSKLKPSDLDDAGWVSIFGFSPTEVLKQSQTATASTETEQSK